MPFPFTGKLVTLTVALGPEELTPAERKMIYGLQQATKQARVSASPSRASGSPCLITWGGNAAPTHSSTVADKLAALTF